jgi:hypothetical protein
VTRFLYSVLTNLITSAVALLLAYWILPQVTVHVSGFIVAVIVFALAQGILTPFIFNLARRYASAILGGIGLISTFLALWIATLFPGGLTIRGIGWVLAPLLVWTVTALGGWILMGVVFKRYLNTGNGRKRS